MNTPGKWFARAGALLVLLGFFLPCMTVSCTAITGLRQSYSLSQLAGDKPFLYVVLLGVLAVIVLSLIPAKSRAILVQLLLGQAVSAGLALLMFIAAISSLYNEVNSSYLSGGMDLGIDISEYFQITPNIGIFLLVGGYALLAIGLVMQMTEVGRMRAIPVQSYGVAPPASPVQPAVAISPPPVVGARLEVIRGHLAASVIPISGASFDIGRAMGNHLQLPGTNVSRLHARLRFAQGMWFIQDQNSTGGTFVNGQRVQAARLNAGDHITIGDTMFVFRL